MDKEFEYLVNVGICVEKLRNIITNDIFGNLSKHNPWYDSQHQEEADKLDELRRTLVLVNDEIDEILFKLDPMLNKEE